MASFGDVSQPATTSGWVRTDLFGPMDPARDCGACDVCCVTLGIDEPSIRKPPGKPCQHLNGRGCGIHATRPDVCREWQCLWKWSNLVPPAEAQPNKLGVMFFFETHTPPRFMTEHAYVVAHSLTTDKVFEKPLFREVLNGIAARFPFLPLWLSASGQKSCVYPPSPLLDVIEGRIKDANLAPIALQWLEGYAPIANSSTGAHSRFRDPNWRSRYATPPPFGFGGGLRLT